MRRVSRLVEILSVALASCFAGEALRAMEPTRDALVPWKVAQPGRVERSPLTLYWIPAASDEMRRSELLASDELTLFSSRCVRMRVVRIDDRVRVTRLSEGEELPMAVLVDDGGTIVGRVLHRDGAIEREDVERLVRDELERREKAADAMLDAAREKADDDDLEGAALLYRTVKDARCTCPRQGRDAERALRKLRDRR